MRLQSHAKKLVAGALVATLLVSYAPIFGNSFVNKAQATDLGDTLGIPINNNAQGAQETVHTGYSVWGIPIPFTSFDSILKFAVKLIIEQMQKEVIAWINGGNNGNPMYETNLGNFLNSVHDKTGTDSVNALSGDNAPLCGYFKADVVNGLGSYFNTPGTSNVSSTGNCTAERQVGADKLNTFVSGDFEGGGGWDTWAAVTQNDDSNPIGAYLTEQDNISANIASKQAIEEQKLSWGNGFHSQEDANGNVVTPGSVIKTQADSVLTSDLRQLEQAKTWDDAVTVLAQSLVSKLINNKDGLRGSSSSDNSNSSSGKYLKPKNPQNSSSNGTTGINTTTTLNTTTIPTGSTGTAGLQNAGLGATATQSSTLGAHDAQIALTNFKNRDPGLGGLSMTESQDNPWWQADLGKQQPIDHIDITPRIADGFGDDLTDYVVAITQNPMGGNDLPPDGPGTWKSAVIVPASPRGNLTTVTPPAGTIGRYVRIQENHHARLEIAGVQIFAKVIPIVTLIGENPLTVAKGSAFEDPGAVAIDQADGDISNKMIVSGASSIDTSRAGTYSITYSVTNSAGVSSGPLSRTVIVQ